MYSNFTKWVDCGKWKEICSQVHGAKILNQSSNRMTKEKWILAGLQLSIDQEKNNILWEDQRDYDLLFKDWQKGKVEVKTGNTPLFTEKTGTEKKVCNLKLKNIYESTYDRTTLDKDFDHLMIVNLTPFFCVAFCDYAVANEHLVQLKDGFKTEIPFEKLTIVYKEPASKIVKSDIEFDPKIVIMKQLRRAGY